MLDNCLINPYWQITETKSKNRVITQRHLRKQNPIKKIRKFFWVRHRASFTETKSRQKSCVPGHNYAQNPSKSMEVTN